MNRFDAGHYLEQFARHMAGTSDTTRRHVDLARVGLGIGNELRDRFEWNRKVHQQDVGDSDDARDLREVERRVDRVRPRQRPDAEIAYGEVSFGTPSRFTSFDHLVGAADQRGRGPWQSLD